MWGEYIDKFENMNDEDIKKDIEMAVQNIM